MEERNQKKLLGGEGEQLDAIPDGTVRW